MLIIYSKGYGRYVNVNNFAELETSRHELCIIWYFFVHVLF